ncbi:transcriptional regulatory protein ZraR [bacterium BMS3Bbin06]|nr:transcriptional regulatory protein ZraR [bacterium BMS3Abin08]GBE35003.1 transcriptional regulatory protein ZraR [bacterium BMS3Bbin06]HDY71123.1 sigma-54-dependent Fis family transcriptional regulator [Nitrospirota bacterium]
MQKATILIIDDEKLLRWSLQQNFLKEGYEVISTEKGMEGLEVFKEERPDIVLLDIHLPDVSGLNLIEGFKEIDRDAIVIMITAYGDVQTAVKAIKSGAYDFIEKPFNLDKLNIVVKKALETVSLRKEVTQLKNKLSQQYGFNSIIGQSDEIKKIFQIIQKVAQSDASTVLIQGESGTGKDLVARVIHFQGKRADMPFMEVNCTAMPESLIESELFGFEKGAFTDAKAQKKGLFELSDGGSIFLDEIGDMRLNTQAKLLKVIESKTFKRLGGVKDVNVDVRVIAATNKDLTEEVKKGNFREDLFFRLKVIPILLPPLRVRKDDVLALTSYFINEFNREFRKNLKGITKETEKLFLEYPWPGNVRELKNVIERVMILENDEYIKPEHLPLEITSQEVIQRVNMEKFDIDIPPGGLDLVEVEKKLIKGALELTKGNQTRAAKLLKLSRDALRYRMQKFDLFEKDSY